MARQLRAVVIGAGWAGEGHTKALQWCGVEVTAMWARQADVVRQVADRLGVAEASTDWQECIRRTKPDIVTLATPAPFRRDVVALAAAAGCHIVCEKPLALTAADATLMYRQVQAAGVKHAYAATQRYGVEVAWLAELLREGAIGVLQEIAGDFRDRQAGAGSHLPPWTWMADWRSGGGRLNNGFPHDLGILARITGGEPQRAMGRVRTVRRELPLVPNIHDIRQLRTATQGLAPEALALLERRPAEVERDMAALLEFTTPMGLVPVTMNVGGGTPVPGQVEGWRLYGDAGTLLARREGGRFSYRVSIVRSEQEEPLPPPQRLREAMPGIDDDEQEKWCLLFRDFVADIRDEPHQPYLTFRDGWRYQVAIDAIRNGSGWTDLPG